MINWFNIPDEGLSNGGLFEVKELEVTENGTYETKGEMYNKVTVNVEGGGGSSDFGTAEVTVYVPPQSGLFRGFRIYGAFIDSYESEEYSIESIRISNQGTHAITLILYKGVAYMSFEDGITPTIEGLIVYDEDMGMYKVTGDCTITIS